MSFFIFPFFGGREGLNNPKNNNNLWALYFFFGEREGLSNPKNKNNLWALYRKDKENEIMAKWNVQFILKWSPRIDA